jgi:hypothetical protein
MVTEQTVTEQTVRSALEDLVYVVGLLSGHDGGVMAAAYYDAPAIRDAYRHAKEVLQAAQNADYVPTDADEIEAQGYAAETRLSVESLRDGALAARRHNRREAWIVNRAADIKAAQIDGSGAQS